MRVPALSILVVALLSFLSGRTAPASVDAPSPRLRRSGAERVPAFTRGVKVEEPDVMLLSKKRRKKKATYSGSIVKGAQLNINACSRDELKAYPLIDAETADAIIEYRKSQGSFKGT
jgi:DNA uptake protein ComE-like DNA-binding protein